jgi:hypothetical protein
VLNAQVKVLDVEIEEGEDELIFDLLPYDSSHFIAIQLGHGVGDFQFGVGEVGTERPEQREACSGEHVLLDMLGVVGYVGS